MQLVSITLNNFQTHKDLEVQFSPALTTIKGRTDAGKSAVLRALRWVCLNDMAGTDFIREGAKAVSVTLQTSTAGITRVKAREGGLNLYVLNGKEFKAFGQGVPPDIAKVLALNEINFQGQHDAPFWFAETAGEVSRRLNAVIDLSIIDRALSHIASEVRVSSERKGICEERLAEAKKQLEELAPQKERIKEFQNVKTRQTSLRDVVDNYNLLADILERVRANPARTLAAQADDGSELLAAMLSARRAQRNVEVLEEIVASINEWQSKAKPPPDFSPVGIAFTDWRDKRSEHLLLERLLELVGESGLEKNMALARAQEAQAKFHAQVRGKVCSLCKQIIQLDERK
jgi:chromosome segregation ATPase